MNIYSNKKAQKEGWSIFTTIPDATHNVFELQSIDAMGVFEDDDAAIRHVVKESIKNEKGFHAQAILFLAKESPNEIDSIVRTAISEDEFRELKFALRNTEMDSF
ncbi:MAG: hypothetical protein ABI091_29815 [Ferruginibacter sp.]